MIFNFKEYLKNSKMPNLFDIYFTGTSTSQIICEYNHVTFKFAFFLLYNYDMY
jgi:hypothetical protein